MARAFIVLIGGYCLLLSSCTQRSICPAFQSAYIHDKDALRKKFSYFLEDSTPKILTASKNKYLIAEPATYRKKIRSLQTVEAKPVPVIVPDSLLNADSVSLAALQRAAESIIDSTFVEDFSEKPVAEDSLYVITKDKELRLLKYNGADSLDYDPVTQKYVSQKPEYYVKDVGLNIEQDNYMWYLRDNLVLPDVRLARTQQSKSKEEVVKKKNKKRKGLKGLFRKKPKAEKPKIVPPPAKKEFDFIDSDTLSLNDPQINEPETKKGFFSSRKNKSNNGGDESTLAGNSEKKKKSKARAPDAEKKKEDEGDGF